MELYILYRLRGYKQPIDDPQEASHVRATADKQINAFKTKVRAVYSRTYSGNNQMDLTTPTKIENENLKGIGITGQHQAPSFNVFISENEKYEIAANLHLLNHKTSRIRIDKVIKGQLKFLPRPLIV